MQNNSVSPKYELVLLSSELGMCDKVHQRTSEEHVRWFGDKARLWWKSE